MSGEGEIGHRAALPAWLGSKADPEGAFKPGPASPEPLHGFFSIVFLFLDWGPPETANEMIIKEGTFFVTKQIGRFVVLSRAESELTDSN